MPWRRPVDALLREVAKHAEPEQEDCTMFTRFTLLPFFILLTNITVLLVGATSSDAVAQPATEIASSHTSLLHGPTLRERIYIDATPAERITISEALGEEGARQLARARSWAPLQNGHGTTLRQGLDQVYRANDGTIHVLEAKGGGSPMNRAYGYTQGSQGWAIKAAERTVKSSRASAAEKEAAKAVLKAASRGELQVHIVRTRHVLGEPGVPIIEKTASASDDAIRLAESVTDDLAKQGIHVLDDLSRAAGNSVRASGAVADDAALAAKTATRTHPGGPRPAPTSAGTAGKALRIAGKLAIPVGLILDGAVRTEDAVKVEEAFQDGLLTQQQREQEHAKNAAGMAGGWAGAVAGAKLGAEGGSAAGSVVAPGPGTFFGGLGGCVIGGVLGYFGGEHLAEAGVGWVIEKLHKGGHTISRWATQTWQDTGELLDETWRWVRGN